jgi:hypothetical protein
MAWRANTKLLYCDNFTSNLRLIGALFFILSDIGNGYFYFRQDLFLIYSNTWKIYYIHITYWISILLMTYSNELEFNNNNFKNLKK